MRGAVIRRGGRGLGAVAAPLADPSMSVDGVSDGARMSAVDAALRCVLAQVPALTLTLTP